MTFKLPEHKKRIQQAVSVTREKSVNTIMDDAISILGEQIERLRLKSTAYSLEDKDVKNLRAYISALAELSREEREREKADELAKLLPQMTDAELLDYAAKKLKT